MIAAALLAALVAVGVVLLAGKHTSTGTTAPQDGGGGTCQTPSASGAPGTVLFRDDFSNRAGQWDQLTTKRSEIGYLDGAYRILLRQTTFATDNPHVAATQCLADVTVAADVTKVTGGGPNGFGVACRTNSGTDSYYVVISSTGRYAIEKSQNGQTRQLRSSTSPQIHRGKASNHIEVGCVGGAGGAPVTVSLQVNGVLVDSVQDATDPYPIGAVGLAVTGPAGLDVRFDDFVVRAESTGPGPVHATHTPTPSASA